MVDRSNWRVEQIDKKIAAEMVVENHYLHRKPSMSFAHGIVADGELKGVITYGVPASRHLQKGACPTDPGSVIELNRMWLSDELPRNSESWAVSRSLKLIPPRIVVSYADTREGHYGYVYRAINFHYAGWTDMERKTPRFDYIPIDPTKHTREATRSGVARRVRRKPKVKYWIATGDRSERRYLESVCGWPVMDWKEKPPPLMDHVQI